VSYSQAAEVATRAGAVQAAAPKSLQKNREADSLRQTNVEDVEEALAAFSGEDVGSAKSSLAGDKKLTRRETRRRRAQGSETRRREEAREVKGQEQTKSTESSKRSEKAEKARQVGPRRSPDWTPDKGLATAQSVLNEQSLLKQASIQFEQQYRQDGQLSPFGQQQAMLDSLINMTEILYHQHTGDKAGEVYNRPATRQILTALRGLKDQVHPKSESDAPAAPRKMKKREFKAQMERIERVQRSLEPVKLPDDYEALDLVA